ncbi:unnamed protein product [Nesidiocoris tenuis]|uniref:Peptidase S1 domain-containing protein n=1 Tax=Nesidiocoris tenuis TaxID=355587 RepID=A0A6H5FTU0_9HEMI|nr:unnamed protein product [Nesidiocoris tenuis]
MKLLLRIREVVQKYIVPTPSIFGFHPAFILEVLSATKVLVKRGCTSWPDKHFLFSEFFYEIENHGRNLYFCKLIKNKERKSRLGFNVTGWHVAAQGEVGYYAVLYGRNLDTRELQTCGGAMLTPSRVLTICSCVISWIFNKDLKNKPFGRPPWAKLDKYDIWNPDIYVMVSYHCPIIVIIRWRFSATKNMSSSMSQASHFCSFPAELGRPPFAPNLAREPSQFHDYDFLMPFAYSLAKLSTPASRRASSCAERPSFRFRLLDRVRTGLRDKIALLSGRVLQPTRIQPSGRGSFGKSNRGCGASDTSLYHQLGRSEERHAHLLLPFPSHAAHDGVRGRPAMHDSAVVRRKAKGTTELVLLVLPIWDRRRIGDYRVGDILQTSVSISEGTIQFTRPRSTGEIRERGAASTRRCAADYFFRRRSAMHPHERARFLAKPGVLVQRTLNPRRPRWTQRPQHAGSSPLEAARQ